MENTTIKRLIGYEKDWIISNDLDTNAITNPEYAAKFAYYATIRNENEHKFFSIDKFGYFDIGDYVKGRIEKTIEF